MRHVLKVYGPYLFKSGACVGRKYVTQKFSDGAKRNLLYSRYVMEQHLGRQLSPDEHVDHIDDDKTNDAIENLQIVSCSENAKKAARLRPAEMLEFVCPECGVLARKKARQVRHNRKQGKEGPFCGKSCAATWRTRR
jgi:predicted RNA-binding Zn-ribbon protein involved in translation (DUF1610 family)